MTAAARSRPVPRLRLPVRRVLLRRELLGELKTDGDLAAYLVLCKVRKLDPWSDEVYPILQYDRRRQGVRVIAGARVRKIRSMAMATGQWAGIDKPVHEYNVGDEPHLCSITVYRNIDGQRQPFTATASYREFCPVNAHPDDLWVTKPRVCLERVAEPNALRMAFPDEVGQVFTREEFSRATPPAGGKRPNADEHPMPDDSGEQSPVELVPSSMAELHRALADCGIKSLPVRDKLLLL